MKIALILADMERTVNSKPYCCLSLASQPHSIPQHRSLSVQKFLQHLLARAKTVPSNQIAEGFEFCGLTQLTSDRRCKMEWGWLVRLLLSVAENL